MTKRCMWGRSRVRIWKNINQNYEHPSLGQHLLVLIKKECIPYHENYALGPDKKSLHKTQWMKFRV